MATFIRLKQIESGSALSTAANVGTDLTSSIQSVVSQSLQAELSQSIVNIIVNNVSAILPDGVVSSSAQIEFNQIIGVTDFSSSLYSTRTALVSQVASVYTALDGRVHSLESFSASVDDKVISLEYFSTSVDDRVTSLEYFSSSLDTTFATDVELAVTTSNLNVDMGEW